MHRKPVDHLRILLSRIQSLFRGKKLDEDLEEELRSHIAFATEENLKRGMSHQEAQTAALREFGGVTQTKETYRVQRGLPFLEVLTRDLRYSFRQLWKYPGFTLTTVGTLAIGIGVNTAIFTMMDAVVLRPLAVPDLSRVVTVAEEQGRGDYRQVALANYESWKQQSRSFEDLAVRNSVSFSMTGDTTGEGQAAHVAAALTSANFFRVLRTDPLLGRVYQESETQPGRDSVVVLTFAFWQKHFAADPAVLGRSINLDGRAYTVIGVMPKSMQYPTASDLFVPLAPTAQQLDNRIAHDYTVVGRLRAGVSRDQAQQELRLIATRLAKAYPASNLGWSARVEQLLDVVNGDLTPLFYRMILAATGFVLLVVCANVANLQFVRGIARRPEIAVRVALGAGRARLLRHLLTENLVLGILGAAGGIGVAAICLHLCVIAMPERIARYVAGWSNISLNGRALAFSLLLALAAGLTSGLLPALKALRVNLVDQLKAGSRTSSGSRQTHRLRDIFAVAQISLSVLLVIGAALMCKGMWSLLHVADIYQPKQILTFSVNLPPGRYPTDEKQAAWFAASLAKLRVLPGVTHAELTTTLPNGQDQWMDDFRIENRPLLPGKFQSAVRIAASSGFFETLHIPLFSGRIFNSGDTLDTQPVAMVSRAFAERYYPGDTPIGHRIQMGAPTDKQSRWVRIVGVVGDVNYLWIDRTVEPAVYLNAAQLPPSGATYIVATNGNPLALTNAVRKALAALDPAVPLDLVQTYQQYLTEALTGLIYVASTLSVNAFIGLLLAAMGIFGVMANMVAERTREIGVRMALGASPQEMLTMILRRAALLTAIGVTAGIVLAAGLARLSANLIFGVRPNDPAVFVSISAAVVAIALLVSWGPARRAASIDPMRALRSE
jgi:putative ABC transport system permease protein